MKGKKRRLTRRFVASLMTFFSVFLAVFSSVTFKAEAASLNQGHQILYSTYGMGSYSTHYYTTDWDGDGYSEVAYCIESSKASTPSGTNYSNSGETGADLLAKVLYYGWGGPGQAYIVSLFGNNPDLCYLVTHIAANYAFTGDPNYNGGNNDYYRGTSADICERTGIHTFIRGVANAPEVPGSGGRRFGQGSTTIFKISAGTQAIGVLTWWRDSSPTPTSIDITVPITKNGDGTHSVNGAVYGLYNSSDTEIARVTLSGTSPATGTITKNLTQAGNYYVKEITPPAGYKYDPTKYTFSVNIAGQSLSTSTPGITINGRTASVTISETPISLTPSIQIQKDGDGTESVAGAVYTMYRYESTTMSQNPAVATATIDTPVTAGDESSMTGEFNITFYDEDAGNYYYIRETTAPTNGLYALDKSLFWFELQKDGEDLKLVPYNSPGALVNGSTIDVVNGQTIEVASIEERAYPVKISLIKNGGNEDPRATLDGAVYTLYKCESESLADTTKEVIKDIALTVSATDKSKATGLCEESLLPGTYFVLEKTAPHGYVLDDVKHFFTISDAGVFASTDSIYSASGLDVTATVVEQSISVVPLTPDINIVKRGNCNVPGDGGDVSKAKFGLFDANDTLLQEISLTGTRTQASGSFTYAISQLGTYYIMETFTPTYFEPDTEKYEFEVSLLDAEIIPIHQSILIDATNKAKAEITVNEIPGAYYTDITVYKKGTSTGDYTSLGGAIYGLYDSNDTEIARTTLVATSTGAEGKFEQVITAAGNYYVKEIKAPEGFRENSKKYPFTVDIVNQKLTTSDTDMTVVDNKLSVNAVDQAKEAQFEFVKKGEDGKLISGATFEVYLKSKLTTDASGSYDFSSATPLQTLTSGTDGKVTSNKLNLGTYVVRETSVAAEYELIDPFEVVLDTDNSTVQVGDVIDKNVPIYVRATKKDSGNDKIVLKAGTTYKIEDASGTLIADRSGATEFVCDNTGVILVDAELAPGKYTITEVVPPNAYKADSTPVVITVDADLNYVVESGKHIHDVEFKNTEKLGEITLTKTGKTLSKYENEKFVWEETPLPGATFEVRAAEDIYSADGQGTLLHAKDAVVDTLVTGANGTGTVKDLHLGKYYLVETVAPVGYVLDATPINVELKDTDASLDVIAATATKFDERQTVILDLYKFDNETLKPLANAEFGLYAAEDIENFAGTVIVSNGDKIASATSDKDGKIVFDVDLPFNKFMVKEEKAPENYVLSDTEFTFTATAPASTIKTVTYKTSFGNTPVKGDVTFIKSGETLKEFKDGKFVYDVTSLTGAEFKLYADTVYTYDGAVDADGNRTTYYKKDEFIQDVVIDANGTAIIKDMPIGTYYLVETKAPYGMTVLKTPYKFEIKYKDQNTPKVLSTESILNNRQKIDLSVVKKGSDGGKRLSGGTFDLYAEEDILNYLGTVIVAKGTKIASAGAKDGKIDFGLDLPHGKYYVKESGGISGYYQTNDTYHLDGSYTSQDIELLAIECTITNNKIPELGRLVLKMGNKFFQKGENNYVTGDVDGTTGYSVLIGEKKDLVRSRRLGAWSVYGTMGLVAVLLAGISMVIIGKRKKKAAAGAEVRFDSLDFEDSYTDEDFDDSEEI